MNSYLMGNRVRLRASYFDERDALLDAAALTCQVDAPDATPTSVAVTVESLGRVYADFYPAVTGVHTYRFECTVSGAQARGEGAFMVLGTSLT